MTFNLNVKNNYPTLWLLSDDRAGTFSQSLALAKALNQSYQIIKIDYNFFSKLPNFILKLIPIHYNKTNLNQLIKNTINNKQQPQIIISAGRKSSLIAIFFKNKFKNTKLIHIMQPEINYNKFDFIIIPNHDKPKYKTKNIIFSVGSLNQINEELIKINKDKFKNFFDKINKKIIVLLVGGNSKKNHYDNRSIIQLCHETSHFVKQLNGHLIILNSRRTPENINELIKKNIDCHHDFFELSNIKDYNPYLASLGFGDYFIATGDSVSMISECCSTGKNVFIFDKKNISSKKHRLFHQELYQNEYALPFEKIANQRLESISYIIKNFPQKKLNEANRIAKIIARKFKIVH